MRKNVQFAQPSEIYSILEYVRTYKELGFKFGSNELSPLQTCIYAHLRIIIFK